MTLSAIKTAITRGERVYWSTDIYEVIKDKLGQYLIVCSLNNYTIDLTWRDGVTMSGEEKDFFIKKMTVGSIMSSFNMGNYTIPTLQKVLALKKENLDASGNYLKGIRDFATKEHIIVSENIVKEQVKECKILEDHISKLLKLREVNHGS